MVIFLSETRPPQHRTHTPRQGITYDAQADPTAALLFSITTFPIISLYYCVDMGVLKARL